MDEKALHTLEFPKILARLAGYCAFSASTALARSLRPAAELEAARRLQAETREARLLLAARPETSIGGARDVRPQVAAASRGQALQPGDLLDIKATLISSRTLARVFAGQEGGYPHLAELAARLPQSLGLVDAISRALSDRGEILDTASEKLGGIRRDLRVAHDRLLTRLQRMVSDPKIAPYLQDNLVTQRDSRYVLPLRAEFKGKVKAVVHDQSSSGATLFVEPLAVVELNNRYRELQLEERDEEHRILLALSGLVSDLAWEITGAVEGLAALDLVFARARYAEALDAAEPQLTGFSPPRRAKPPTSKRLAESADSPDLHIPPGSGQRPSSERFADSVESLDSFHPPGSTIRLWQARHPLLDPQTVVPIDVVLDPKTYVMVITGPNTGGKTVTLKTVGLLALMAQAGLHLPVLSGSELSVFPAIYADIGDEQSIEQSLSTFSGHIKTIIHILQEAGPHALVILDELGAGTDPQEGAALAQAILSHLVERGVTTLVATHYPELKAYAHATPGVVNASAEFDLETLSPTYHLTVGLPGRSNALAIAQRLGLPEHIVAAARAGLDPAELRAEDLLDEIHRQRDLARAARATADQARREAEAYRGELIARLEGIEDERRALLEQARGEAAAEVAGLQAEIAVVRKALEQARQPLEALEPLVEQAEELEAEVEAPVERRPPAGVKRPVSNRVARRAIRLGDRVRLRALDTLGVVGALGEEQAEVQVGNLRVRARLSELELVGGEAEAGDLAQPTPAQAVEPPVKIARVESPGTELDIRGRRVDDALEVLEAYLDSAYLAGLPYVRIIHGKGTGRLREAVRQALQGHPHVGSSEPGLPNEGGDGVTVAKMSAG